MHKYLFDNPIEDILSKTNSFIGSLWFVPGSKKTEFISNIRFNLGSIKHSKTIDKDFIDSLLKIIEE